MINPSLQLLETVQRTEHSPDLLMVHGVKLAPTIAGNRGMALPAAAKSPPEGTKKWIDKLKKHFCCKMLRGGTGNSAVSCLTGSKFALGSRPDIVGMLLNEAKL